VLFFLDVLRTNRTALGVSSQIGSTSLHFFI